jgi:hypothetical protein
MLRRDACLWGAIACSPSTDDSSLVRPCEKQREPVTALATPASLCRLSSEPLVLLEHVVRVHRGRPYAGQRPVVRNFFLRRASARSRERG